MVLLIWLLRGDISFWSFFRNTFWSNRGHRIDSEHPVRCHEPIIMLTNY